LRSSHPFVENRIPVGWALRVNKTRRFRIFENVPQTTRSAGVPSHDHKYFLGPFLMAQENRSFSAEPATVTVHAVCVRLLNIQLAKPRQPGTGTTRKG
jgi:hypothetical protein